MNGETNSNLHPTNGTGSKRKRSVEEAELNDDLDQIAKRGKVYEKPNPDGNSVIVEDDGNGAILINDD